MKLQNPKLQFRLEKPIDISKRIYMDMFIEKPKRVGVEFKYKTKEFADIVDNEQYQLTSHAATNNGRYDFLHDVQRLENLKKENIIIAGIAILLTSDPPYWRGNPKDSELSKDFLISDAMMVNGKLSWFPYASVNSIGKERLKPIYLSGSYKMKWQNYSIVNGEEFRYLMVRI